MNPIVGTTVIYTLTEQDAVAINNTPHAKNAAHAGDHYPALVVRAWSDDENPLVQLKVFYDGTGSYWATSVNYGDGERQWHRPVPA